MELGTKLSSLWIGPKMQPGKNRISIDDFLEFSEEMSYDFFFLNKY